MSARKITVSSKAGDSVFTLRDGTATKTFHVRDVSREEFRALCKAIVADPGNYLPEHEALVAAVFARPQPTGDPMNLRPWPNPLYRGKS